MKKIILTFVRIQIFINYFFTKYGNAYKGLQEIWFPNNLYIFVYHFYFNTIIKIFILTLVRIHIFIKYFY